MDDPAEIERLRAELEETKRELQNQAPQDSLTGLPTARAFRDRLEDALAWSRRLRKHFAILYLSLDGFNEVTAKHGSAARDHVLIEAAKRLKSCVREVDVVARMGGDEFSTVLQSLSRDEDVTVVCGRIIKSIREPFVYNGQSIRIGISIGVAVYADGQQENLDEILVRAAREMAIARKAGGNTFRATFATPPPRRKTLLDANNNKT